jgi:hypothetical protein
VTIVAVKKPRGIMYSECVLVAFGTQHAMHMHRVISSSVVCSALQQLPTLSRKRHNFRKNNVIEHKKCVLISSTTSV